MKIIEKYWELPDFCYTHGRVIPHNAYNSKEFTSFHCADKRHDDSETIRCSEGIGVCEATFSGILSMHGYVVKFKDEEEYLFCTESELNKLKEESKKAEMEQERKREEEKASLPENPARPRGLKISRSDMVIEYKAYEKCTEYPIKMQMARSLGYLTPPYYLGDYSFKQMLCKDDCIFCHCPFYADDLLEELRHNHRNDYDEWVMGYFKNFK